MKTKRHCDLCDNQILDINIGLICNVTKTKPSFINLCTKIKLNNILKNKLEDVLIEYEYLKQHKKKLFVNSYVKLILGFFIFCCGCLSLKFLFGDEINDPFLAIKYIILVPAIILTTGFYYIKIALTKLFIFKKELLNATESKEKIDKVLNLYVKKYSYTVNFDKEVHGIQNVKINMKFI